MDRLRLSGGLEDEERRVGDSERALAAIAVVVVSLLSAEAENIILLFSGTGQILPAKPKRLIALNATPRHIGARVPYAAISTGGFATLVVGCVVSVTTAAAVSE